MFESRACEPQTAAAEPVAAADAKAAEDLASEVLSVLRGFVEALRIEFMPPKQPRKQQQQQQLKLLSKQLAEIPLHTKLNERGIPGTTRSIIQRAPNRILRRPGLRFLRTPCGHDSNNISSNNKRTEDDGVKEDGGHDTSSPGASHERQRRGVLCDVALPLAELLAGCYSILDSVTEKHLEETTTTTTTARDDVPATARSHRKNKNRPKPPIGMLSIRDYTDVACLLEFIVCTGILPSYGSLSGTTSTGSNNNNTSGFVEDRLRNKLPKSLAGRIPTDALRWGTSSSSIPARSYPNNNNTRPCPSLLVHSTETLARVVLLDRFRPMLLPRHLVDLYEACFRAEYLAGKTLGRSSSSSKNNKNNATTKVVPQHYRALGLHLSSPSSPTKEGVCVVVDPTLRAMAYQTLLSSSSLQPSPPSKPPPAATQSTALSREGHYHRWLRGRVSALLTELATSDPRGLSAIVTVFVPVLSSSTDRASSLVSGAAQRLGKTLAMMTAAPLPTKNKVTNPEGAASDAANATDHPMEKDIVDSPRAVLCRQFLALLVAAFPGNDSSGTTTATTATATSALPTEGIPPRSMAVIQTAWTFFQHLPVRAVEEYVVRTWTFRLLVSFTRPETRPKGVDSGGGRIIHETIRQIGALCAFVPPHSRSSLRFLEKTFLTPIQPSGLYGNSSEKGGAATLLGQVLRVAVSTLSCSSKDAGHTLLWLTQVLYAGGDSDNDGDEKTTFGREGIIAAWVAGIAPTPWDTEGNYFCARTRQRAEEQEQQFRIETTTNQLLTPAETFSALVRSTTERAEFFVEKVLLVLAPPVLVSPGTAPSVEEGTDGHPLRIPLNGFPSRLFRFLLRKYLYGGDQGGRNSNNKYDTANGGPSLRLVATILLPVLCEKCSHEQLLFGDQRENASNLLLLIRDVLSQLQESRTSGDSGDGFVDSCSSNINKSSDDGEKTEEEDAEHHPQEFLKSISSILMSMLITVMELGSKSRSPDEEDLLRSFLPTLRSLSVLPCEKHSGAGGRNNRLEDAAMADMAAYAMALIASRGSPPIEREASGAVRSKEDRLKATLDEAARDLGSTQAPIRAKGIVSLGRLARGFGGALSSEQRSPFLVQEVDGFGVPLQRETVDDWIGEVLRLSMVALGDTESYVYLAAIQTIVAMGDLRPKRVLPAIASAIVRGELGASSSPEVTDNKRNDEHDGNSNRPRPSIELSREQVIKLAEAAVFIIRRRAVTDEYVPLLMRLMLYGKGASTVATPQPRDSVARMQQETDAYFATGFFRGKAAATHGEGNGDHLSREELDLRLRTGGPVFVAEEAEIVSSLRITILSELVAAPSTASEASSLLSPWIPTLARLVVDVLHLEDGESSSSSSSKSPSFRTTARSLPRAAALLARELYARVLSEGRDLSEALENGGLTDPSRGVVLPIASALAGSADEEVLCAALATRASPGGRSTTTKTTTNDATVVARCKEALVLRERAALGGVFLAAGLVREEGRKLEELPALFRGLAASSLPVEQQPLGGSLLLDPVDALR